MPELIDRRAALEIAMSYCSDDDGCCSKAGHDIREMLDEIESLPTIQPEVRRGRWTKDGCEHKYFYYRCSVCGVDNDGRTKFCPNCGAKMDGGDDDADM